MKITKPKKASKRLIYSSHLKNAISKLDLFCQKYEINTDGMKDSDKIRVFASHLGFEINGNIRKWLVEFYRAGTNEEVSLGEIDFYSLPKWRDIKYKVLTRYGAVCMKCGANGDGVVIHVDHIKPRVKYPELQFEVENAQVLCLSCNCAKRDRDETDYRPEPYSLEK